MNVFLKYLNIFIYIQSQSSVLFDIFSPIASCDFRDFFDYNKEYKDNKIIMVFSAVLGAYSPGNIVVIELEIILGLELIPCHSRIY